MNQDLLVRSEPRCSHTELTQLAHFHRIEAVNPQQPTTHSMDGKVPNSSALGSIHASVSFPPSPRVSWFATPHHARGSILGNVMYQCKRKRAAASTHRRGERGGGNKILGSRTAPSRNLNVAAQHIVEKTRRRPLGPSRRLEAPSATAP